MDELVSWMGLIRDQEILSNESEFLTWLQDKLMTASALLAMEPSGNHDLPQLLEADIYRLEAEIDKIEKNLPALRSFILPGGHPGSSYCHIARSICRRSERLSVPFLNDSKQLELVLKLLNRLSDYLFVLARFALKNAGIEEIKWNA